jgi:hypothetical protein
MKVTTQIHAYIAPTSTVTPQELQTEKGVRRLQFMADDTPYWRGLGYTYVGPAEITVDVPDLRELVENKINALREQATTIRAEATAKCTEIEGQIQNLLAIEYSPAPVEPQ